MRSFRVLLLICCTVTFAGYFGSYMRLPVVPLYARTIGASTVEIGLINWKIFEISGTKAGQEAGYALLGFGAVLSVVGLTTDRLEVFLSNLMAYDAIAQGNWGADPVLYPELLRWVGEGRISLAPYVESHPLDRINEVFDRAHHGGLVRRVVLVP